MGSATFEFLPVDIFRGHPQFAVRIDHPFSFAVTVFHNFNEFRDIGLIPFRTMRFRHYFFRLVTIWNLILKEFGLLCIRWPTCHVDNEGLATPSVPVTTALMPARVAPGVRDGAPMQPTRSRECHPATASTAL